MALIDRIFHTEPDPDRHIANHALSAALWFFAKGPATGVTRDDIVAAFEMTSADEVQLDELIAHYQALSPARQQEFHSDLEAAGVLAEAGLITRARYKTFLGMA